LILSRVFRRSLYVLLDAIFPPSFVNYSLEDVYIEEGLMWMFEMVFCGVFVGNLGKFVGIRSLCGFFL
jgi:hypothetical protein